MADCECLENCAYFNYVLKDLGALQEAKKRKYCQGDNSSCARYMVFKARGSGSVPKSLAPNQIQKAKEIISQR